MHRVVRDAGASPVSVEFDTTVVEVDGAVDDASQPEAVWLLLIDLTAAAPVLERVKAAAVEALTHAPAYISVGTLQVARWTTLCWA